MENKFLKIIMMTIILATGSIFAGGFSGRPGTYTYTGAKDNVSVSLRFSATPGALPEEMNLSYTILVDKNGQKCIAVSGNNGKISTASKPSMQYELNTSKGFISGTLGSSNVVPSTIQWQNFKDASCSLEPDTIEIR